MFVDNNFVKLKKLEVEYLRLLEISPHGEERMKLFKSQSIPMEKCEEQITFLENEILKTKEELISEGIDINSYLGGNNS